MNTSVFDWLHIKKWCSELNEFSFISEEHSIIFVCKSGTDQSSHRCLHKITEFNKSAKNFNCSHGSFFKSDHKQLKQFTMLGLCQNSLFCTTGPERGQKITLQHCMNPVTNWISCPLHHSFTIHFLSYVAHRHSDLGISCISCNVSNDPKCWKLHLPTNVCSCTVGNAYLPFLSKTLQDIEIHSSVVLLNPVLQNLINTDQIEMLRYVENLLLHLVVLFCIKL